ncbi:retrotransposon protein, putative, ty1-copia subclass [Tanacetum coccineum]
MCSVPGLANREAPEGDADYAGCRDSFKSTSGGTKFLGKKLVSWSSKKQDCTSLSTTEAEYCKVVVYGGMEHGFLIQKGSGGGRDTSVGVASAVKEGVTPSVVDMMVEMERLSSLEDTTVRGSFLPISRPVTTTAGIPYLVKLHGVPVTAFSKDGLSVIATKLGTPLMIDSYTFDMCMQSWGREDHYICNVHVEYEWKPPRCASCKIFGHIHEECLKNIGTGEKKTLKKPSQTSQATASSTGNKKKGVEPTIEVSNSNPFEVLNLVDNDVELGTNRGTTNLVNNGATSSGSSFMNVDNSSTSTIPIIDKIMKFEELLTSGQAILMDEVDNTLKKVKFPSDYDSEDEVASVDNDMAHFLALERIRRDLSRETLIDKVEVLRQAIIDLVMQCTTLPATQASLKRSLFHFSRSTTCFYRLSHSEIVDIEKKSFTPRGIQDYLKAKDQDIKFKDKDVKIKIKIQDHKHAKGTAKEFPRIQGSKIRDVTKSEAISEMTTP